VALVKTLFFTVFVPGTVTVLAPRWILAAEEAHTLALGAVRILGAQLVLLGAVVYLCAWDFAVAGRGTPLPLDPPRQLVARGLYRYARNPMYIGIVTILVGEALFFESRGLLIYAAAAGLFFHLWVLLYEEPALRRQFGESYERYRREVPRWIPRRLRKARRA
jgi:protein-S-isoprenylcysteine O-methyltransferase Ste14